MGLRLSLTTTYIDFLSLIDVRMLKEWRDRKRAKCLQREFFLSFFILSSFIVFLSFFLVYLNAKTNMEVGP